MPNMSLKKVPMPEQEPNVRNHNFQEVSLGYTKEMAMEEAARCLNCKHKPCVGGCPVNIRIPEFIAKVAEGDFQAAYDIISDTNAPLASAAVSALRRASEARCVRHQGRAEGHRPAGALWPSVPENVNAMPQKPQTNGIKVAVVGSGPASLTCASDLAKHGYEVTIFEAFHTAGGVLVYGIPEFRLPKAIVQNEVDKLTALGVDLETDMVIGKTFDIDEMFEEGYEAVFIGSGAGLPMFMGIEGETLAGVYSANEYLTRINLMKAYREGYDTPLKISGSAAIIGGGNVAMDAARCAKRMGAEHVYVVYRRSEEEMPARREEIHHAKEEGIEFLFLNNPVKILGDDKGRVRAMECIKMELGEPDASGRRRPIEVPGSEFELEVDAVIMSLGTSPNPLIRSTTPGLDTNK
ncbi:MAG: FAD-dependent oxidoreductase, partial [Flavonifractor plautii]